MNNGIQQKNLPQIIIQMPAEEKPAAPDVKEIAQNPVVGMFWAILLLAALWYVCGGWEYFQ